ncbi:hypothetical protein NoPa_00039 [Pseudomonas phage vB_PpuM-NoPa]|uniref:Uncharacterized protein n=1 Tax=Pseudomonas phage vB_PpuM-NoPa TaxID=3132619 RepID=A0AAX4MYI2_9CAUD
MNDKHVEALIKEYTTHAEWRILPEGAKREDKHQADLHLMRFGTFQSGGEYAYGLIFNDSRFLFPDNSDVRTSIIVDKYEVDGVKYIETRNTIYKLI